MPQRSIAFVQERRHTINEDNWRLIFGVGVAALVLVLGFSGLSLFIGPDLPDLSAAVLTSRDFPHDFLEPSPEEFGIEVGESIEEGLKIESAFVLLRFEPLEMILGVTTLISNKQDQADFDRIMRQGDALLEDLIQGLGGDSASVLAQPELFDLKAVGDESVGMTIAVNLEGDPVRADVVFFRRDVVGAIVYVYYFDGESPLVPAQDVARKLDERIIEVLSADD